MTCDWESFTGIKCTADAAAVLHDAKRNIDVPVCLEHFEEFRKDKAEGRV